MWSQFRAVFRRYSREEIVSEEFRGRMTAFAEIDLHWLWYMGLVLLFSPYLAEYAVGRNPESFVMVYDTVLKWAALAGFIAWCVLSYLIVGHQGYVRRVLIDAEIPFVLPSKPKGWLAMVTRPKSEPPTVEVPDPETVKAAEAHAEAIDRANDPDAQETRNA